MANVIYPINRGIGTPLQFKGFLAQYIYYGAGVIIGSLILFIILFIAGVSNWICLPLMLLLGGGGVTWVNRLSQKYGQYGLMKRSAARRIPKNLRSDSRKPFIHLKQQS